MLVTNHMEVSKKPEQNYTTALSKEEPGTKVQEQTTAQVADKEVEVAISDVNSRKSVLSDDELNVALENVLASQSNILDVDKADDMIRAANRRILENANDSVLAQANQSSDVVKELCK